MNVLVVSYFSYSDFPSQYRFLNFSESSKNPETSYGINFLIGLLFVFLKMGCTIKEKKVHYGVSIFRFSLSEKNGVDSSFGKRGKETRNRTFIKKKIGKVLKRFVFLKEIGPFESKMCDS